GTIECEQCGQCLRVCPVGALIEQNFKYTGRVWEMAKTATTCPYCGVGCTITLNVKQGRIHRVTSDSEGLTEGNLCVRGRFGIDFVTSDARLESPMIRINGKQKRVSWDKALDLVAETFTKAKKKAAGSVAVLGSPRCTNEDNYQLAKFARECLGTKNIDFSDRAAYAETLDGIADVVGVATAATNSLSAVARAEAILMLDADVSESNPQFSTMIQDAVRRGGAHLTVADGRRTKLARYAAEWLPITPGSEAIVLGAVVRRVSDSGSVAAGLGAKKISELAASLDGCSLEAAAEMSGVEADRIAAAADAFARAGSGAVIISGLAGRGVGTLAADLVALTGNIGEAGGVYVTGLPNNWQGAVDMGVSPAGKGLLAAEIIQAAADGKIKALYVMGDNPLGAFPGAAQALENVDFLVVQDIFSGPLTEMADVVLPAAAFAEKRGTFTNMERRVQGVRPAVRPVGEARPDVQILADLAGRMGVRMASGAAEVMDEISGAIRHYKHINYEALEAGPMWWPASKKHERGASALTLDALGKGFPTPAPPGELEGAVFTDDPHTYRLVVGAKRFVSGRASRFAQGLRDVYPEPLLEMSPADAAELGVKDLTKVAVRSPHACVEVRVKITPKSLPGTVFLPTGLDEAPVGELLGHNGAARAAKAAVSIEKVQRA
ncbi:MAG: molybdopterin-dependent oxidoreductase, partial [Planctomycetota bacterium]